MLVVFFFVVEQEPFFFFVGILGAQSTKLAAKLVAPIHEFKQERGVSLFCSRHYPNSARRVAHCKHFHRSCDCFYIQNRLCGFVF
jgi:hypothetical protein